MRTHHFNGDEFIDWSKKQDLTMSEVSRTLGFENGYMSKVCRKGVIPIPSYKLLVSEFGFEYGRFLIEEKFEPIDTRDTNELLKEIINRLDELMQLLR